MNKSPIPPTPTRHCYNLWQEFKRRRSRLSSLIHFVIIIEEQRELTLSLSRSFPDLNSDKGPLPPNVDEDADADDVNLKTSILRPKSVVHAKNPAFGNITVLLAVLALIRNVLLGRITLEKNYHNNYFLAILGLGPSQSVWRQQQQKMMMMLWWLNSCS